MSEEMNIFEKRPFKVRNAEDFNLNKILDVFVDPFDGARSPFDYENNIIKGAMGSGKSMLLKANYAYHLYSVIPALLTGEKVVLPMMIKLSDYQHLRKPEEIYKAVIIGLIKEVIQVYVKLQDLEEMARIHNGMQSLPSFSFQSNKLAESLKSLVALEADEYKDTLSSELGLNAGVKPKFLELGANFKESTSREVLQKSEPGISDLHDVYRMLLENFDGGFLVLIDEAGSLDKSFFREDETTSLFETLMNQLRTAEYLRTKIAVYPHSYSDMLTETRYGDMLPLTEDVVNPVGYERFRERAISIMDRYIQTKSDRSMTLFDVFNVSPSPTDFGDSLEQVVYASGGNVRRLLAIADGCMQEAYSDHKGGGLVQDHHVRNALVKHSTTAEALHVSSEREFLNTLAKTCKSRSTFRFKFPYKAPVLAKFVAKSEEHNVIKITEAGSGRRGTTYEFDYAFCLNHDIPTHYIKDSERIDKTRSQLSGDWIKRVTQISEEVIRHAEIAAKIEGEVDYMKGESGFIRGDDGKSYYLTKSLVIAPDQGKAIIVGKRIRFYPSRVEGADMALAIEVL